MRYRSTRSLDGQTATFSDILLAGLAPDGGLYLPESYPQITEQTLVAWRQLLAEEGYAALASAVLELFVDDIPAADLAAICQRAYTSEKFGSELVVPVEQIGSGRLWLAHISQGPTAAFKDMAMQLLGELFEYELARRGGTLTIVGATSGDTGSSAEAAMAGRQGIQTFMLTPAGRMTAFQRAQMFSIDDPSVVNVAVDGVFDACQDLVKSINSDAEFKQRYHIGAVNSINWARLMAQVVYYIATYLQVSEQVEEPISFAVPTGNFGNICAGHIARQMGLPIRNLILATNENDVLDEFFNTGIYRPRTGAEVHATSSPSMDISKASNFERFIFDLVDGDADQVTAMFSRQLMTQGHFDISDTALFEQLRERYGFLTGSSTHADRVQTIAGLHHDLGLLIDPHTADGVHVAHGKLADVEGVIICLETALPVKFAETITEAIGVTPELPERFSGLLDAPQRVEELPNDVEALKALIERRSVLA